MAETTLQTSLPQIWLVGLKVELYYLLRFFNALILQFCGLWGRQRKPSRRILMRENRRKNMNARNEKSKRKSLKRDMLVAFYYIFARFFPTQPIPGYRFGYWLRRRLCTNIFLNCGEKIIIKRNAYFGNGSGIIIGHNSQLGEDCVVPRDLVIGNDVIMGPQVIIYAISHEFSSLDKPIRLQGATPRKTPVIGDDVWIGARVVIMPGVRIGSHAVIGTGSIVTRDVPKFAVAAGIPARIIRYRNGSSKTVLSSDQQDASSPNSMPHADP